MDLSIVIVNYNTKELLLQTLESVFMSSGIGEYEVFVVDNASSDGSCTTVQMKFPSVKLICNRVNVGFASANNQALREASGRYVLLLNSDTVVKPDTLDTMLGFMDTNLDVGAAGCKVVKPDGSLDLACRRSFPTVRNSLYHFLRLDRLFPSSRRFGEYNLTYLDENESNPVDCLVGAFMMVRREVIDEVGLLDELFFMYAEDIDWSYRIKEAGWAIWYVAETSIVHYKGSSSAKRPVRMIYEFHHAMLTYFKKHHMAQTWFGFRWLVYLGILASFALMAGKNTIRLQKGPSHSRKTQGTD